METKDEIFEPTADQAYAFFKALRETDKEQWYELLNGVRFAELRGGGYLAYLAEVLDDPSMMAKMTKHAADEAKHAHFVNLIIRREGGQLRSMRDRNLFRSMNAARGNNPDADAGPPTRGCPSREDLIEVFAGMQAVEISAKVAFQAFERLFEGDEVVLAMVREVLKDEEFHIGWIAKVLDRWRAEGDAERIDEAIWRARKALAEARARSLTGQAS